MAFRLSFVLKTKVAMMLLMRIKIIFSSVPIYYYTVKIWKSTCKTKAKSLTTINSYYRETGPSPSTKGRIQSPPPFVRASINAQISSGHESPANSATISSGILKHISAQVPLWKQRCKKVFIWSADQNNSDFRTNNVIHQKNEPINQRWKGNLMKRSPPDEQSWPCTITPLSHIMQLLHRSKSVLRKKR